jgi:ankyrin repeat protein
MLDPLERLRNAVILGNLPITKRLLLRFPELWLNIDANNNGWNNLHYASYHGHYLICFHLISWIAKTDTHYSQLDLLTFDGLLVLHLSTINHHHQILHYLLQDFGRPWINLIGGPSKQTPLHYSCVHGFKQGVELLLDFGADYTVADIQANNCFHLCFQFDHLNCVYVLLKYILTHNPNRETAVDEIRRLETGKNSKGWVPFDYAPTFDAIEKYKQMKKDLLALNLDVELSPLQSSNFVMDSSSIPSSESSILNVAFNKSSTSLENNKILSSPIVSVAKKGRIHSQSLSTPESQPRPKLDRQRSNTIAIMKPPALSAAKIAFASNLGSNTLMTPQTPSTKTPSLKSVTISPSQRYTNTPPSPQSTISTASSLDTTDRSRRRRSLSNATTGSNGNQWSFLQSQTANLGPVQESLSSQTILTSRNSNALPQPRRLTTASSSTKLNGARTSPDRKSETTPSLRKTQSSGALLINTTLKPDQTTRSDISSISFARVERS